MTQPTIEDFIEKLLSLGKQNDEYRAEGRFDEDALEKSEKIQRKVEEMKPLLHWENTVELVKYYEARIVKLEAESMRMTIMREVVRQVVREEQAK